MTLDEIAERDAAQPALLRATVGASAGLTPAQAARLQGSTQEEMEADAAALLSEFGTPAPALPRSGGNRGNDVAGQGGPVERGAALYRAKHNIGEDGQRLPAKGNLPRSEWSA